MSAPVVSKREGLTVPGVFRDLSLLTLTGLVVLVLLTFGDYGITNDEEVQNIYGKLLLAFYTSFFDDQSAFFYIDLYRYGGLFDLTAAILNLVSPLGEYETRHLLGGLIGVLGLTGAWKLGSYLAGERAGFLAMALLGLIPAFYGHSFNNPKDAPFASAMIWAVYYICRIVAELPQPRRGIVLKFGVAFGVAIGIRVGAVLLIPYAGLAVTLYLYGVWRDTHSWRAVRNDLVAVLKAVWPALVVAYALMALFWPWAVQEPGNPIKALFEFSSYPIQLETLVDGEWVKASHLPAEYLPDYLLVNLPEMVLAGLAFSVVFAGLWAVGAARHRAKAPGRLALKYTVVATAAFFPVLFFVVSRPTAYNGMRHFLFVLPPMAVLAAVSIERLWAAALRWRPWVGRAFAVAMSASLVTQMWVMGQLHPDEYVYYNMLTGGVKGAQGAYELDYWGNSLLEATRQLADYIEMENPANLNKNFKVAVCGHRLSASYFFPPFMHFTKNLGEADFLIAFTQADCHKHFKGKQIIAIERFGAALSVVKDRRDLLNRKGS